MKRQIIYHIGDIHYPDNKDISLSDKKDRKFDYRLTSIINENPMQIVFKEIKLDIDRRGEKSPIILFSGDFSTKGDKESYKEFLLYIDELLLHDSIEDDIHVVPGNHDIPREEFGTGKQFDHIKESWKNVKGWEQILPIDKVRKVSINKMVNNNVSIYSINTCNGCGGRREILGAGHEEIYNAIKKITNLPEDWQYDTLDTPAISSEDMIELSKHITENRGEIPIVLTHHNLLPQRTPQIALYSELINGGRIREYLLASDLPVLFCHGHIHTDLIEVVTAPNQNGIVIIVSAPEISQGYNTIEIVYGKKDIPIGCIIQIKKINNGNATFSSHKYSVPFYEPKDFLSKGDKCIVDYLSVLKFDKSIRGSNYLSELKKKNIVQRYSATVAHIIEEASWFNLIKVENIEYPNFEDWIITKVVP